MNTELPDIGQNREKGGKYLLSSVKTTNPQYKINYYNISYPKIPYISTHPRHLQCLFMTHRHLKNYNSFSLLILSVKFVPFPFPIPPSQPFHRKKRKAQNPPTLRLKLSFFHPIFRCFSYFISCKSHAAFHTAAPAAHRYS